ncbi:sigma 54-interacting transcriptional regulator [Aeromonas rivipollensis]|uniref:sigma-54-dependent transcriptional regulator n=1 Tax=Aeromonas rivipollensis TaxID=948519 RepID=UPI0027D99AF6|nr:sigma 54-interacting transcriptional regulator [uncultured Aeromonas sp.]MDU1142243.1 sigma-54 dependent transcriptional regulator [Aeromonas hydrophila]
MTETALLLINSCAVLESLLIKSEWQVEQASSLAVAEQKLQEKTYPLVLVAIKPEQHDALYSLIGQYSSSLWIGLIERDCLASEALRNLLAACFHDFHTFPLDQERLSHSLGHALGMAQLIRRHRPKMPAQLRFIQGESSAIRQLREQIMRLQHCRLPVLVTGPSGTGKELVARELHYSTFGEDSPFVAVNCGAMPHQLIQSELFGHVKGAFTGAQSRKIGKIEAADGGTLFLDEIGELPLEDQATLLRFLQEQSIEAVGSHLTRTVDVRVIAATNIDVEQAVASGGFRMDLYYRLNVVRLRTPALCERAEDIQLLADDILAEVRGGRMLSFTHKARQAMQSYGWPGNVRELRNRVQRAAVMCSGPFIEADDMELTNMDSLLLDGSLKAVREAAERQALQRTLARFPDQLEEVARTLDISRATLYRLLDKHDLL